MNDKICKKCNLYGYLQAFSFGKCEICNDGISTPHIPCYKVCDKCAEKNNLCLQCGEKLND